MGRMRILHRPRGLTESEELFPSKVSHRSKRAWLNSERRLWQSACMDKGSVIETLRLHEPELESSRDRASASVWFGGAG